MKAENIWKLLIMKEEILSRNTGVKQDIYTNSTHLIDTGIVKKDQQLIMV